MHRLTYRAGTNIPAANGFSEGKTIISNCYDHYFKTSAQEFFGTRLEWLWLKAQAFAESGLDPEAVSPVGAIGVMQALVSQAEFEGEKVVNPEALTDIQRAARYLYLQKSCFA